MLNNNNYWCKVKITYRCRYYSKGTNLVQQIGILQLSPPYGCSPLVLYQPPQKTRTALGVAGLKLEHLFI